jgi:tRNA guanosine-2'-O-methyltransferase
MVAPLQSQTARLLLDRVAEPERHNVVRDIAKSLSAHSGRSDLELAATLLQIYADDEASKTLLDTAASLIENGRYDEVVSICGKQPALGNEVLVRSLLHVSDGAERLEKRAAGVQVGTPEHHATSEDLTGGPEESMQDLALVKSTTHYLHFANRMLSGHLRADHAHALFRPALTLLAVEDATLSKLAHETLSLLIAHKSTLNGQEQETLWSHVQSLIQTHSPQHRSAGHGLWLRWVSSGHPIEAGILRGEEYWQTLVKGLRHGDGEIRKCCLQILRSSVDSCVQEPFLLAKVAAEAEATHGKSGYLQDQTFTHRRKAYMASPHLQDDEST